MKRTIMAAGALLLVLAGCDKAPSATPGRVPEAPGAPEAPAVPEPPAAPDAPDAPAPEIPDIPDGPGEARPEVPAAPPPINIPAYQQVGATLGPEVKKDIESEWKKACGDDTVCVKLDYAPADASLEAGPCKIIEPYPSGTVERGGTVTYVLDRPCG